MYDSLFLLMKKSVNTEILKKLERLEKGLEEVTKGLKDFRSLVLNKFLQYDEKLEIIDRRTEYLPRLYDNVDKPMGEITENRQERVFINNRLKGHENRIVKLEKFAFQKS